MAPSTDPTTSPTEKTVIIEVDHNSTIVEKVSKQSTSNDGSYDSSDASNKNNPRSNPTNLDMQANTQGHIDDQSAKNKTIPNESDGKSEQEKNSNISSVQQTHGNAAASKV